MKVVKIAQPFHHLLMRAVDGELAAVALVDREGNAVSIAGAIEDAEAMPLAALVLYRLHSDDLTARLFTGEVLALTLDDRTVAVAIAKRQLFVVAVLREATAALIARVDALRDQVANMLVEHEPHDPPPPHADGGRGGGGGAAELQLVELGITMPRVRPKA